MTKPVWACSQDSVSKRWKYHLPQPPEHSAVGDGEWLLKASSAPTPLPIAHTAMARQAVMGLQQPGRLAGGKSCCIALMSVLWGFVDHGRAKVCACTLAPSLSLSLSVTISSCLLLWASECMKGCLALDSSHPKLA